MTFPGFCRIFLLAAIAAFFSGCCVEALFAETPWNPVEAACYSRNHGGTVLLISRNGRIVFEEYEKGMSSRTALPGFSITKSLVALACLAAPEINLSDKVGVQGVTIRHLLSQTSGVATGYNRLYSPSLKDVRKSAAALKCEFPPGAHFAYGPSHYEMLGSVSGIAESSGYNPVTQFLGKIGIKPAGWKTDRSGNVFLSSGVFLTPADLLKAGKFVLNRGRIHGFFTLIPPSKFREAVCGTAANPCYGLGFWLNKMARENAREQDIEESIRAGLSQREWQGTCISLATPQDLVCMAGTGGQRVYVIPSLRTVIVRMGHPGRFRDPEFLKALFSRKGG